MQNQLQLDVKFPKPNHDYLEARIRIRNAKIETLSKCGM